MKKTWKEALLSACILEAKSHPHLLFTNQNLIKNRLAKIVEEVGSKGKTPQKTMSRILQELRDENLILFISPGIYQLKNNVTMENLIKKEKGISSGEKYISNILSKMNIKFIREKTFKDLRRIGFLRFDFYFKSENREFVIEYDGIQHSKPIKFFGGEEGYKDLKFRDNLKEKYCIEKNIHLIRIDNSNKKEAKSIIKKKLRETKGKNITIFDLTSKEKDILRDINNIIQDMENLILDL